MKSDRENKIIAMLKADTSGFNDVLILGGAQGVFLNKVRESLGIKKISTVEIDDKCIEKLKLNEQNVVYKSDLNQKFPFSSDSFDLIVADQVIEHIIDIDSFLDETHRVLKKDGKAIISTENLSSLVNIISLIFGYRPLSIHYSYKINVGNPFSTYSNKVIDTKHSIGEIHHKVFTPYTLETLLKYYKFVILIKYYNGFMPLPNFFAKIFKRHSFFMTYLISK